VVEKKLVLWRWWWGGGGDISISLSKVELGLAEFGWLTFTAATHKPSCNTTPTSY
jgi:hypothetical protein